MTTADLLQIMRIATEAHPTSHEDELVFAERLELYPAGCHVLASEPRGKGEGGTVLGYVFSHPWRARAVPALNSYLGTLPESPDSYYIHDLALTTSFRSSGAGSAIVKRLIAHAQTMNLPMSLVALPEPAKFWQRHGFRFLDDPALQPALASYGERVRLMVRELVYPEKP